MSESLYIIYGVLVLVVALSLDAFAAGIAYGSDKIRVSWHAAFLISLVGSLFLAISLSLGKWIQMQVHEHTAKSISVICLLTLGIWKLLDYQIKSYINHHQMLRKDIHFSISRLRFFIIIYGNPAAADKDESRSLSIKEALIVSAAMSLDSLVAGVGASDWKVPIIVVTVLSLIIGTVSVISGYHIGDHLSKQKTWDLSWLSGVILISLAFLKWK